MCHTANNVHPNTQLTATKMLKLVGQGHPPHIPADVIIKRADGEGPVVRARGHLDEVLEMNQVMGFWEEGWRKCVGKHDAVCVHTLEKHYSHVDNRWLVARTIARGLTNWCSLRVMYWVGAHSAV